MIGMSLELLSTYHDVKFFILTMKDIWSEVLIVKKLSWFSIKQRLNLGRKFVSTIKKFSIKLPQESLHNLANKLEFVSGYYSW